MIKQRNPLSSRHADVYQIFTIPGFSTALRKPVENRTVLPVNFASYRNKNCQRVKPARYFSKNQEKRNLALPFRIGQVLSSGTTRASRNVGVIREALTQECVGDFVGGVTNSPGVVMAPRADSVQFHSRPFLTSSSSRASFDSSGSESQVNSSTPSESMRKIASIGMSVSNSGDEALVLVGEDPVSLTVEGGGVVDGDGLIVVVVVHEVHDGVAIDNVAVGQELRHDVGAGVGALCVHV